jgi:hypothetical protein
MQQLATTNDNQRCAWSAGRFSANTLLPGV